MSTELDKAIDSAAQVVGGNNYLGSFGNDANFVPSGETNKKGDPLIKNTDTPDKETDNAREEIRRKVDHVAEEYNLTEREKIAYVHAIEMDAVGKKNDMYGMGGVDTSQHAEKDFLANIKEHPTRASRAAGEKAVERLLQDSGLSFTPDPELQQSGKGRDAHGHEGQAAAAHGDERSRTIEAALRKGGLYDTAGKWLHNGQEDGNMQGGATKALEKFEKAHGLHGDASDAAAIDALAASGKIDQKFAEALKQISGDGTLAKLETKFGSPVHVPEEDLASSRDKAQKPATGHGQSQSHS